MFRPQLRELKVTSGVQNRSAAPKRRFGHVKPQDQRSAQGYIEAVDDKNSYKWLFCKADLSPALSLVSFFRPVVPHHCLRPDEVRAGRETWVPLPGRPGLRVGGSR